jgi:hypothetical protein
MSSRNSRANPTTRVLSDHVRALVDAARAAAMSPDAQRDRVRRE